MCLLENFLDSFGSFPDDREAFRTRHCVDEMLLLTLFGLLCGAEGWRGLERYGNAKLPLLREILPFRNGIASAATLMRFYRAIDAEALRWRFVSFVASLFPAAGERLIAIDGKTARGSRDGEGKGALHTVSAYAAEARLVLAQVATEEKSNEITAIPLLLDLLDIKGAVVSTDAMGCQKAVARKILEKGGDYVLGLKGNQGTLHGCTKAFFEHAPADAVFDSFVESGKGHGREESRKCDVTGDVAWLEKAVGWPGLKSIVRIVASRTINGKTTTETRYYVSSLPPDAKRIAQAVRSHWAIENSLHWVLDMTFGEDASRIRKDNAPAALAVMRHTALNILRTAKTPRDSVKGIMQKAGWDDNILRKILNEGKL